VKAFLAFLQVYVSWAYLSTGLAYMFSFTKVMVFTRSGMKQVLLSLEGLNYLLSDLCDVLMRGNSLLFYVFCF
jgi:hypothetical protein